MFAPHQTIVILATRRRLLFLPFQGFQPILRLVLTADEKAGLSFNWITPALTTSSLWRWPDINAMITINHLQMKHHGAMGWDWMDGWDWISGWRPYGANKDSENEEGHLVQALVLCLSPGPHDAEHEVQGDHRDQPPSTGGHTLARLIVHSEVWWFGPSQARPPL